MKLKEVASTKRADGKGYYKKFTITPVPKEIAEKSELIDKKLKARVSKGKIILEEA